MHFGLNIKREGLILYLDAANIKSYPQSGGVWYNLNGLVNNGILYNNPTFISENLGGLSLNGSNMYIQVPFSSDFDFSLSQTICMWLKPSTGVNSVRRNPYNQAYGGSGTLTHEPAGSINYYFGTHGGNSTPYVARNSGFNLQENELAFICVTRSQTLDLCRWYKNGNRINSNTAGGYAETNNGNSAILIGAGYVSNYLGTIYLVAIYNSFFTDEDVSQIYNATKGRFGL